MQRDRRRDLVEISRGHTKNGTYGHHNTYQDPSLLGVMKISSNQNAEYTFDIDNSIATDLIGASSVDENEL